jgi:N,N'-diacetyllegionaminate synthase
VKQAVPYIIAEIASAHEGDPVLCSRLIRLAAGTGADAVKLQIFHRDTLMSRFHPRYESFGQIEIAPQEWRRLLGEAAATGADVVVEAFDERSLMLAEETKSVSAYKLPTSDIGNPEFLRLMGRTGKPVMLGVGGARDSEITAAIEVVRGAGAGRVVLMHGFQAYPTKIEDTRLARLSALARAFAGVALGYADHADAEDRELARMLPAMAFAAGATVIEKHITDARSRHGRDRYSALNPDEFLDFVRTMRRLAAAIGRGDDALSAAEDNYRREMKRQAVAARGLAPGATLSQGDVAFKRTNRAGLSHGEIQDLGARKLAVAKAADEPIGAEDLA